MIGCYDSEIELLGDVGVLTVSGETDMHTAPLFRRDLEETIAVTSGDVVLDLTDLELVDSSALGIMLAAGGRMMAERRALVLVVSRDHVLRVLAITGARDFFPIAATRTEAMMKVSSITGPREVA